MTKLRSLSKEVLVCYCGGGVNGTFQSEHAYLKREFYFGIWYIYHVCIPQSIVHCEFCPLDQLKFDSRCGSMKRARLGIMKKYIANRYHFELKSRKKKNTHTHTQLI
jgi:hypothetical protein